MVGLADIEAQMKLIGVNFRHWGRAEKKELCHILTENEKIVGAVNGRYEGGFASLVATDQRLLLIDKKPWFLTVEDIRYDMIAEIDYSSRVFEGSVTVMTFNKTLHFRTMNKGHLRPLTNYVQKRVMDLRQHGYSYNPEQPAIPNPAFTTAASGIEMPTNQPDYIQPAPQAFEAHGAVPQQPDDAPTSVVQASPVLPEVQFDTDRTFLPRLRPMNPYTRSSLMMRHRVSRF